MAIPKGFKAVRFSRDGHRVAFVVEKDKKHRAVIDGRAEPLYDNVTIVAFSPSGKHYYYGGQRDKKWHLVRDGKEIAELDRLAYAAQDKDGWAVVIGGEAGPRFSDVGNPVFVGKDNQVTYTVKAGDGWKLRGRSEAGPFQRISELAVSPDRAHLAYAARRAEGKWQVFRDGRPVGGPCDGVVAQTGIRFDRSGKVRFIARVGDEPRWVTGGE